MTVDLRAIVATDLGLCISGDVGCNHISDRSGLQMFSGRLTFEGIVTPPRGTPISFLVACPQTGTVTRFPHPLRVVRAVSYPLDRRSEIEVGCLLTLMSDKKEKKIYGRNEYTPEWTTLLSTRQLGTITIPIYADQLLLYCLRQVGITRAATSSLLSFRFMREEVDLSGGYVQIIGSLLRSEGCFGRLRPDETFEIRSINRSIGQKGPILRAENLVSIEPITGGQEPPTTYKVIYNSIRRQK
jgi:hypothetical protein